MVSGQPDFEMHQNASEKQEDSPNPVVSVVIPIFNHESYIVECLESIKRDKYRRIEIVAIDDGSSDSSYEFADEWLCSNKDRFEAVKITKQLNSGIPVTLNRLVHQSVGEFIFPLASDDQVATDGIFNMVRYYKRYIRKPTLLFSNIELIDLAGLLIEGEVSAFPTRNERLLEESQKFLKFDIITSWGTPFQHQFYPRVLFDAIGGYDEDLKFEDLYFALKNVAGGTVAYAPVKSRRYRVRPKLTITPGLDEREFSPTPTRRAVAQDFNIGYRMLISLLCYKDALKGGVIYGVIRAMFSFFRRSLIFVRSGILRP